MATAFALLQEDAAGCCKVANEAPGRGFSGAWARPSLSTQNRLRAPLALARKQAEHKGLPYQTYIKSLLHETLTEREKLKLGW